MIHPPIHSPFFSFVPSNHPHPLHPPSPAPIGILQFCTVLMTSIKLNHGAVPPSSFQWPSISRAVSVAFLRHLHLPQDGPTTEPSSGASIGHGSTSLWAPLRWSGGAAKHHPRVRYGERAARLPLEHFANLATVTGELCRPHSTASQPRYSMISHQYLGRYLASSTFSLPVCPNVRAMSRTQGTRPLYIQAPRRPDSACRM